jgi:hypothetical protein
VVAEKLIEAASSGDYHCDTKKIRLSNITMEKASAHNMPFLVGRDLDLE